MGVFSSPNMIISFTNIIFFIIIQILFFRNISSKQFNNVLTDKINILNSYMRNNRRFRDAVDNHIRSSEESVMIRATDQEKDRVRHNDRSMMMWLGLPLLICVGMLVLSIVNQNRSSNKDEWTSIHSTLLTLSIGVYLSEILFYYGVVRQYQFYGDHHIYSRMYDGIHSGISREPITEEGRVLRDDIRRVLNHEITVSELLNRHDDISSNFFEYNGEIMSALSPVMTYIRSNRDDNTVHTSVNVENTVATTTEVATSEISVSELESNIKKITEDVSVKMASLDTDDGSEESTDDFDQSEFEDDKN